MGSASSYSDGRWVRMPLDVCNLLSVVLLTHLLHHHRGTDNKTRLKNSEDPAHCRRQP